MGNYTVFALNFNRLVCVNNVDKYVDNFANKYIWIKRKIKGRLKEFKKIVRFIGE